MLRVATTATDELDAATLVQAKAGSERACRLLFRCYSDRVHGYLWGMLGARASRDSIEDLTQDTFLRVFKALRGFNSAGPAKLSTWILTIAHRLALNELRRQGRQNAVLVQRDEPEQVEADAPLAHHMGELGMGLQRALDGLSEDRRAVVLLHDGHGLTLDEAAEVLQIPAGTVKSRLSRARAALRQALESHDEQA